MIKDEFVEIANRGRITRAKERNAKKAILVFASVLAGGFLACFGLECVLNIRSTLITFGCLASVYVIYKAVMEVTK